MKIAQINSVYNQGSTGKIVKSIHDYLIENNYESKVFYGRGNKVAENNVIRFSNKFSIYLDVLNTRLFNKHSEGNKKETYKLIEELKVYNPDIIHLHNIHGYYLNYEILFEYLRDTSIPVVWLMHDQWALSGNAAYFNEDLLDWENPNRLELKKLSKDYPSHIYFGINNIMNVYKNKKHIFNIDNLNIITPSKWLKDVFEESFFSNKNIQVINNGIDIESFKVNSRKNSDKIRLLGVSNVWDRRKGLLFFEKLAYDLDKKFEITIVGLSEKQQKKMPKNVRCISKTKSIKDLSKLYSEADVFINPTLQDNFPTVNLESQASGTPVITFNTGGSSESIISDLTGQSVKKGDYEELLEAIKAWPKKNKKIEKDCRSNSLKYTNKNMVENYLKLYNKVKN